MISKSEHISVLVASNKLNSLGGAETFTYTLIEELANRTNVSVEYFTFKRGIVSDKIEDELGVKFKSRRKYDLILANHNSCVNELFNSGFIIQTCHGIFPELEQPSYLANAYVSISEEVQEHLASLGYPSKIIHNGLNLKRFNVKKELNFKLKTVLSLCHSEEANQMVKSICKDLELEYLQAYKYGNSVWDVERVINKSDLVIGLGRSAFEAMACGRPVIIYDDRKYFESCGDGYVKNKLGFSLKKNCSGRYFQKIFDLEELKDEFFLYNKDDGDYFRKMAIQEFDICKNVDLYFEYWHQLKANKSISRKNRLKKSIRMLLGRKIIFMLYKLNKSF